MESVLSIWNRVDNRRFKLHVRGDLGVLRIGNIKRLLEKQTSIPVVDQVLMYRGREIHDQQTGSEVDLVNGATIDVDTRRNMSHAPPPVSAPAPVAAPSLPSVSAPPAGSLGRASASAAPAPQFASYEDGLRYAFHAEREAYARELEALAAHQERLRRVITSGEQKLSSLQEEVQRVHAELENARLEEQWTQRQHEEVAARRATLEGEIQRRREEEQQQLLAEKHRQEAILSNIDSRRRDLSWRFAELDRSRREQELSITAAERELQALEQQLVDECHETDRRQVALDAIGPVNPVGVPPRAPA
eukprot:TRINITY_DN44195_c0_g1_i1.p1 TRINITY_DN44195_c0_g1~~TRINITY_DN44195_c0_g1_i1.p1  ORF type:complete len:304 (+),score=69.63 TRINITY_DN44195_c0_g1_i1:119-1030(+)